MEFLFTCLQSKLHSPQLFVISCSCVMFTSTGPMYNVVLLQVFSPYPLSTTNYSLSSPPLFFSLIHSPPPLSPSPFPLFTTNYSLCSPPPFFSLIHSPLSLSPSPFPLPIIILSLPLPPFSSLIHSRSLSPSPPLSPSPSPLFSPLPVSLFYLPSSFFVFIQAEDEIDWQLLRPDIFATIMDFFSSGLPVVTDEHPSQDTGKVSPTVCDRA